MRSTFSNGVPLPRNNEVSRIHVFRFFSYRHILSVYINTTGFVANNVQIHNGSTLFVVACEMRIHYRIQ